MSAVPVGLQGPRAERQRATCPTTARSRGGALLFTDDGALTGAPEHHYAALVGSDRTPVSGEAAATGGAYRGPQGGARLPGRRPVGAERLRRRPVRQGHRRPAALPRHRPRARRADRVDRGGRLRPGPRRRALRARDGAARPGGRARREDRRRGASSPRQTQLSLPGDRRLQQRDRLGQAEPRRPHPARREPADPLDEPGQAVPGAAGHRQAARAGSAPASRTTRGSSPPTASTPRSPRSRSASSRPSRTTCARCATSPTCSTTAPARSCTRSSPTARSTSGTTRRPRPDGAKTNDFNTDETVKFPSIVALVWRWTGDDRFRDDMYDFAERNLHYVDDQPRRRRRRLARGLGQRRAAGHGRRRSSTTPSTTSAALLDLADMARAKHDGATDAWATGLAAKLRAAVRGDLVVAPRTPVRGLADRPGQPRSRSSKHWIGAGADGGRAHQRRPGDARRGRPRPRHDRARRARGPLLQRRPPRQPRPLPHRLRRRPGRQGRLRDLLADDRRSRPSARATTAASAPSSSSATPTPTPRRCSRAGHRRHARRAARRDAGDLPVGADFDAGGHPPNIDRCWTCRSMFMQAWGNYGTAWPVVHQQLGVRPDLGDGRLEVVPQVPRRPDRASRARRSGSGAPARWRSRPRTTARPTARACRSAAPVSKLADRPHAARRARRWRGDARRPARDSHDAQTNRGARGHRGHRAGTHTLVVTAA